MIEIDVKELDHVAINQKIRQAEHDITLTECLGQRFIAAGMDQKHITIAGVPGNALGAYLNGAEIEVMGNAQDAVGDTMNAGRIVIHGNIGDAAGYAMRGGEIYVEGDAGYRAGIHMKEYHDKKPVMLIGGRCGSFLGEYQAGGLIVVLGLHESNRPIVGNFPCTGMHGGKMFLRNIGMIPEFPRQVSAEPASAEDMEEIKPYIENFCNYFGYDFKTVFHTDFTVIKPDSKNPYKQMYVAN